MTGARVLYVPNEIGESLQSGYRRALEDLRRGGALEDVQVFSLERRIRAGGDGAEHRAEMIRTSQRFRPTIVLAQHLGATGVTEEELRRLVGSARMVYHEADPYTRRLHPLPAAARAAGRVADVVLTVGAGTFTENFRRSGARRVEWTPHVFDPGRIGAPAPAPGPARASDVTMIANRSRARLRPLPDADVRRRFVARLQARFGSRLALHGAGWSGPGARGRLPYDQQHTALQGAWVSANWDHFADEPCYFSDRLAISLASGSVHATTLHPGHAAVFPESTRRFLLTGASPEDLVEQVDGYLGSTSPAERQQDSEAARAWAWQHLRQDDHLVLMLNRAGADIDPTAARGLWDPTRPAGRDG